MSEFSIHAVSRQQSTTSLERSGDSAIEREGSVLDSGIKLPPGTALVEVPLASLRPTQMAVGMQQVQSKVEKVQGKMAKGADNLQRFLRKNPIPVVKGPGSELWMIDHHHLGRALHQLHVPTCWVGIATDYSSLGDDAFWQAMAQHRYLWPFNADGTEVPLAELPARLPRTVAGLRDDPYRSLSALVRKSGGFAKSTRPFSEFVWANYLRERVPMVLLQTSDVEAYVSRGIVHATGSQAEGLPGYNGLEGATEQQLDLMGSQQKVFDDD